MNNKPTTVQLNGIPTFLIIIFKLNKISFWVPLGQKPGPNGPAGPLDMGLCLSSSVL